MMGAISKSPHTAWDYMFPDGGSSSNPLNKRLVVPCLLSPCQ